MKLLLKDIGGKRSKLVQALQKHVMNWIRPTNPSLAIGTLKDLPKTKSQLIAENALLRQQLIVLNRQVRKPHFTPLDRILLVCLSNRIHGWKQARKCQNSAHAVSLAMFTLSQPSLNYSYCVSLGGDQQVLQGTKSLPEYTALFS